MIGMNSFLISILILNAILLLQMDASHFQGGTITYKILDTSGSIVSIALTQTYIYDYSTIRCNSSMIANQSPKLYFNPLVYAENTRTVQCIQYCNQSTGYVAPSVVTPCTDFSVGMSMTVGQRSDIINLTNGSFFLVAYQSASYRLLSLPTGITASNATWSISTLIDLRVRANGQYNQPPVATIISPIYIPVGIRQIISIPTIDADNDDVRCRYAQGVNECGAVCPPASLPNGTLIFSNCTLHITGAKVGDWYAVTLAIEDFSDSTSSTPFSIVPVQFLINVQNTSSCSQRPVLNSSVATQDACVGLQVNQTYEIQLIAEVLCPSTTILDISTISFPVVIKSSIIQNTTMKWSVALRWTPTVSAIGSQILCAVAIDSNKVQSNQYCMSFTVAAGSVPTCPGEEMETTLQTTTTTTTTTTSTTSTTTTSSTSSVTTEDSTLNPETTEEATSTIEQIISTDSELETSSVLPLIVSTVVASESTNIPATNPMVVSTTASTSSDDSSLPWLWVYILIGATAFTLSILGLSCCCYFCCPGLCAFKSKRKRRNSVEHFSTSDGPRHLSSPFPFDKHSNPVEPDEQRDRSYSLASTSSTLPTPRCPDNIELEIQSNEPRWRIVHCRRLLHPSPRVTPMSMSSPSSSLISRSSGNS